MVGLFQEFHELFVRHRVFQNAFEDGREPRVFKIGGEDVSLGDGDGPVLTASRIFYGSISNDMMFCSVLVFIPMSLEIAATVAANPVSTLSGSRPYHQRVLKPSQQPFHS